MSLDGQRVNLDRYSLVPRTLSFLIQDDQILLLKLNRGAWSGLYNGIGGHIEQGEDPLSAARREVEGEAVAAFRRSEVFFVAYRYSPAGELQISGNSR